MGFCSHTKALLKKEWLLWKRNLVRSVIEILIPWALMVIIVILRDVVPITPMESSSNVLYTNVVALSPDPFVMGLKNLNFPFQKGMTPSFGEIEDNFPDESEIGASPFPDSENPFQVDKIERIGYVKGKGDISKKIEKIIPMGILIN